VIKQVDDSMKYTEEEKRQFSEAQERSKSNDLPGTLEALKSLVLQRPDSAMFSATYANTLKESGDLEGALHYFRRAVVIEPTKELYSLGLFHCLWRLEKREEALAEMRRFVSIAESADYQQILRELNES